MNTIVKVIVLTILVLMGCTAPKQKEQGVSTASLVRSTFKEGKKHCKLDFYAGTLMLHGAAEFGMLEGNEDILNEVISHYQDFSNSKIQAKGNFISYEAGGSGAALLSWQGKTAELDKQVAAAASKMMETQKRTHDNIMTAPNLSHEMFIDVAFAVTPYLLYAGLKFDKPKYIDYAVFHTLESFRVLKDDATGLVHQGRGFQGEGVISEDCWSRGNGWGAFALALLARDLPESHPQWQEVIDLTKQFFTAVLEHQNDQGLWYQEMTRPDSYVETSGSGLMLYGLGIALEKGFLDKKYMQNFEKGIASFTAYVGSDGSVSHTSFACRCPGDGSKETYVKHPWVYNDHHAFGPAVLAFTQAAKMGIEYILPTTKLGQYCIADTPDSPRTYAKFARGSDLAWENDRIAFRVFGAKVRGKVANGIDVWGKSVDYSILDKWYQLNEDGKDYHEDRGEGADFYNMGKRSGCGAISIWMDGKAYGQETYDKHRIIRNQDDRLEFDLWYNTWDVPGMRLKEHKKVRMNKGSNLFEVTSKIISKQDTTLTIAIGLSTFGAGEVTQDLEQGYLSVWEEMQEGHGSLGTAVVVDPEKIEGFTSYEGDELILMSVKTNEPFTYYAGAGWDKAKR